MTVPHIRNSARLSSNCPQSCQSHRQGYSRCAVKRVLELNVPWNKSNKNSHTMCLANGLQQVFCTPVSNLQSYRVSLFSSLFCLFSLIETKSQLKSGTRENGKNVSELYTQTKEDESFKINQLFRLFEIYLWTWARYIILIKTFLNKDRHTWFIRWMPYT